VIVLYALWVRIPALAGALPDFAPSVVAGGLPWVTSAPAAFGSRHNMRTNIEP
jgi:hypothetical protein